MNAWRNSMPERRYSRDEVDAILGRAIERERGGDELSHEQLLAIAQEVGVSADSIERAATEISVEVRQRDDLARLRKNAWRGFVAHLIPYVCVNGLLIVLNLLTTRFPWALFPILGWGIGILSHLLAVAMPNPDRLARQLERERERERRRQLKTRVDARARDFEVAVGEGAAALLHAAANRINRGAAAVQPKQPGRVRVDDPSDNEVDWRERDRDDVEARDPSRRTRR